MKKLNYLFLALSLIFCVTLTSCEDDNFSEDDLVGEWTMVRSIGYYEDFEDPDNDEAWDETIRAGIYNIYFDEYGTFLRDYNNEIAEGDWWIRGENLYLANDYDEVKYRILKLTSTSFVIEESYRDSEGRSYEKTYYQRMD